MKNLILKHLIKDKTEDVVHSSVYAKAQNPEAIGTSSVQSFNDRVSINQNRRMVKKYTDSQLIRDRFNREKNLEQTPLNTPQIPGAGPLKSGTGNPPARKNPGISR